MTIEVTEDYTIAENFIKFKGVTFIRDPSNPDDLGERIYQILLPALRDCIAQGLEFREVYVTTPPLKAFSPRWARSAGKERQMKWFADGAVIYAFLAGAMWGLMLGKDRPSYWLIVPATAPGLCGLFLALSR